MHLVVGRVVGLDRQEGARPHMQRHEMPLDAALVERLEKTGREMQPGRGGRDGTVFAGIDGLVVGLVLVVLRTLGRDIGRQRNVAGGEDRLVQSRAGEIEVKRDFRLVAGLDGRIERAEHACLAAVTELDTVAGFQPLGGTCEGLPARAIDAHMERDENARPSPPSRVRKPSSCAGITFVSLKTSASPGWSKSGRSRTPLSDRTGSALALTTSMRALSRGLAGRSAMFFIRQVEVEQVYTHCLLVFPGTSGMPLNMKAPRQQRPGRHFDVAPEAIRRQQRPSSR